MANEQSKARALKLGTVAGMAVLLAAAPISVQRGTGFGLPTVGLAAALAKSGDSGSGGGGSGSGGHSGSGSGHSGGSDDSGHHSGSDDSGHHGDHHSGSDDSGHHSGVATGGGAGGQSVVKVESSATGIEVTYGDGSREEIENGRYEAKNSAGRTVVERPATQADIDRLNALF